MKGRKSLTSLSNIYLKKPFSHIYVENQAFKYDETYRITNFFKNSQLIEVSDYRNVFNSHNQNFNLQKKTPDLILAVKKDNFLYKGSDLCHGYENMDFYYLTNMINCLYDCDYCFIRGMYTSANIVYFVNTNDFFDAVAEEALGKDVFIPISYESDLLVMESIFRIFARWYSFCVENSNVNIEVRTKSSCINVIKKYRPVKNILLSWTLSPDLIISSYEKKSPPLQKRIKAVNQALEAGWKVRLSFDPILLIDDAEKIYTSFFSQILSEIPVNLLFDINIGFFRMPKTYFREFKSKTQFSPVLYSDWEYSDDHVTYSSDRKEKFMKSTESYLKEFSHLTKVLYMI